MDRVEINNRILEVFTNILERNNSLNKTKLAQSLGIKPAKFTEILKGRMFAGPEIMSRLSIDYGVSSSWMLTGKGSMFSSDNETINTVNGDGNVVGNNIVDSNVELPDEQIRLLITEYKKHIEALEKSIASLESQLAAKDAMIAQLLDIIKKQQ